MPVDVPGDAPGQAPRWAITSRAEARTLGIVRRPSAERQQLRDRHADETLPRNAGYCNHRADIPMLFEPVRAGTFDACASITRHEHLTGDRGRRAFDRRKDGWIKTELQPAA